MIVCYRNDILIRVQRCRLCPTICCLKNLSFINLSMTEPLGVTNVQTNRLFIDSLDKCCYILICHEPCMLFANAQTYWPHHGWCLNPHLDNEIPSFRRWNHHSSSFLSAKSLIFHDFPGEIPTFLGKILTFRGKILTFRGKTLVQRPEVRTRRNRPDRRSGRCRGPAERRYAPCPAKSHD